MRIAVSLDMHIDTDNAPESWHLAKAALKTSLTTKPDHVILAGDIFDSSAAMLRDRETLQRYLHRVGLWHRDRATLVVGNHDIFRTAHHGGPVWQAGQMLLALKGGAHRFDDEFCEWAGQLTNAEDSTRGRR